MSAGAGTPGKATGGLGPHARPARDPGALLSYGAVGLAGWGALALVAGAWPPPPLAGVLLLTALSVGLRRLGFELVPRATHSLAGVADLAALLALGPAGGALVAAASIVICQGLCVGIDRRPTLRTALLHAFGRGGLAALVALAAAGVYAALGGRWPLTEAAWPAIVAVLGAAGTRFLLDHLGWCALELPLAGARATWHLLRAILFHSLLIELLPLPLAMLLAVACHREYVLDATLVALALVGGAWVLRRLMVSLDRQRRHLRELGAVASLGQVLLGSGADLDALAPALHAHCRRIASVPAFALYVRAENAAARPALAKIEGVANVEPDETVARAAWEWLEAARRPLAIASGNEARPFPPLLLAEARSALYLPLASGPDLMGLMAIESPEPDAFDDDAVQALTMLATEAALGAEAARLYRRERERASQLMAIAEVSRKVAAILDLQTLFADTVRLIQETFGYYHVSIFTAEPDQRRIRFQASSAPHIQARGVEVAWGEGIVGHVAATGEPLLVNDVRADPRFVPDAALERTRAEVAVPLMVENRLLGLLDVQNDRPGSLGEGDLFVLRTLAAQVAIAVEDSHLYQAQQEEAWVSTALFQAAEAVARLSTADEVLQTVVRLTPVLTGAERCLIWVWSDERQAYAAAAHVGLADDQGAALAELSLPPEALPPVEAVRIDGEPAQVPAAELARFLPPPLWTAWAAEDELLLLPLRTKGEVLGVMVADAGARDARAAHHRQTILTGIAGHAAMALDNARLYAAQREEAWVSTALLQVANVVNASADLCETLATVARMTSLLVGVDWCALLLWQEGERTLVAEAEYGLPRPDAIVGRPLTPSELPLLGPLMASGQPVSARDAADEGLMDGRLARELGVTSLAAVPLRARNRLLGVLLAGQEQGEAITGRRLGILAGIANQTSLAIEAAQLYQQELQRERLQRDIELARGIQQSFLPECCPEIPGWQLAAEWRAARGVGGDFYDFWPLGPHHWGLAIADVSDKGVGAALYMALSRTVLRAAAIGHLSPAETLRRANQVLLSDSRSGMFVSVFYAVLDAQSGRLSYVRAGHNPPLLVRAGASEVESLHPWGMVLGIAEELGLEEEERTLGAGDMLVLYTDGVIETVNEEGEPFGEERLQGLLRQDTDAQVLVARIDAAVRVFSGDQEPFDDVTLVVLRREG